MATQIIDKESVNLSKVIEGLIQRQGIDTALKILDDREFMEGLLAVGYDMGRDSKN
jgi:hypothetical protein